LAELLATARSRRPSPVKGSVAVAQQHRHGIVVVVGDGQVEVAVAGEVARHDGYWIRPHGVSDLGLKGAVAVAQKHRYGTGAARVA
jgi:hypothetical protein